MLTNIWRYSHFLLAVFSFLFLFIASVTGIILSAEPIVEQTKPYSTRQLDTLSLSETIPLLNNRYDEILSLSVNESNQVAVSVISIDEETDGEFYIDPSSGEKIAGLEEQSPLFQWATTLHRSLFLHTTGRWFMAVASFLLLLMACTGFALILKRTNGIRHFLKPLIKQNSSAYYHTLTGRIMLIPIIIVAFTGTYLFLNEMSFLPRQQTEQQTIPPLPAEGQNALTSSFFTGTNLSDIREIEFPFSDSPDDYYIVELKDREVQVNQRTGRVVSVRHFPFIQKATDLSMKLHTGRGTIIWALVLGLASVNILYFIYSGARISWRRLASKISNRFTANDAKYVLLVGSENGTTRRYASILFKKLIETGKKAFMDDLNNYQQYPHAEELMVITSTYGDGEPPSNASHFLGKARQTRQNQRVKCSVIGFGSLAYPQYCQFALDVYNELNKQPEYIMNNEPHLIHNQSFTSFKLFVDEWALQNNLTLNFPNAIKEIPRVTHSFKIIQKKIADDGYSHTFILELAVPDQLNVQSGDLFAVLPEGETVERLYSIGYTPRETILLSIKRHEKGVCTQYLSSLATGQSIEGRIQTNTEFHQPPKRPLIFVANGTGIAPFLGMIQQNNHQKKYLYFGGRNHETIELYEEYVEDAKENGNLTAFCKAFSRLPNQPSYVQELILRDAEKIAHALDVNKATVMICGSVTMQNGVLEVLNNILKQKRRSLDYFIANGQVLMDCY